MVFFEPSHVLHVTSFEYACMNPKWLTLGLLQNNVAFAFHSDVGMRPGGPEILDN
jgi:hypothetical protein